MAYLGALAAFGSSCTWAFGSSRYAHASREVGSARVNLARAVVVAPIYAVLTALTLGRGLLGGVDASHVLWLVASVICSYGVADNFFFSSCRRLGTPTALAIA